MSLWIFLFWISTVQKLCIKMRPNFIGHSLAYWKFNVAQIWFKIVMMFVHRKLSSQKQLVLKKTFDIKGLLVYSNLTQ